MAPPFVLYRSHDVSDVRYLYSFLAYPNFLHARFSLAVICVKSCYMTVQICTFVRLVCLETAMLSFYCRWTTQSYVVFIRVVLLNYCVLPEFCLTCDFFIWIGRVLISIWLIARPVWWLVYPWCYHRICRVLMLLVVLYNYFAKCIFIRIGLLQLFIFLEFVTCILV